MADSEIMIVDERLLKDKIYIVRGTQVMLDFELAIEQSRTLIRLFNIK